MSITPDVGRPFGADETAWKGRPTGDEDLWEVFRLLWDRAGMAPEAMGSQSVAHAVRKRVVASGAESAQAYARRLLSDPAEFQELLEELVVPESWFFRDALAFRRLDRDLGAWRSPDRGPIRALSVGCSTGEEAYSLAMTLREAGLTPGQFRILAVDMSRRALELAKDGRFPSRSFRGPDQTMIALRDRWCKRIGDSWQVRDELRAGVEFRWGNLAEPGFLAGEPAFQVIFCRNVLIYFHPEARRVAVGHLRRLLSPEGLLCSAPAEARIFSEAGFSGLGSECPFAFRRREKLAQAPPADGGVARPEALRSACFAPAPNTPRPSKIPGVPPKRCTTPVEDSGRAARPANASDEGVLWQEILKAAQQAADDGRLEAADELCGRVLARDPASADAHYLRGVVRQAQGMWAEAQRSFDKVLYLNPRHYQALVHMMLLAEQRGDDVAAANFRRRAQRTPPGESE
jgi:chemotaxis protein methyltransferase WspC